MKRIDWKNFKNEVDGIAVWHYGELSLEQDSPISATWRVKHVPSGDYLGYSFDKFENAKKVVEFLVNEVDINWHYQTALEALEKS